jgi:hypothetical protein
MHGRSAASDVLGIPIMLLAVLYRIKDMRHKKWVRLSFGAIFKLYRYDRALTPGWRPVVPER